MVAVTPGSTANIRVALLPSILRLDAPGPMIVRFLCMPRVLPSVIVPVTPKIIVSPEDALSIALRSEPGPLSLVLVTVIGAPNAAETARLAMHNSAEVKDRRREVAHVPSDVSVYRYRLRKDAKWRR